MNKPQFQVSNFKFKISSAMQNFLTYETYDITGTSRGIKIINADFIVFIADRSPDEERPNSEIKLCTGDILFVKKDANEILKEICKAGNR